MTYAKKMVTSTLLLIVLSLSGCIFLMRSCLAKYDERSALPPVLYFNKDGKQVLISIVKFAKATSYSSKGGMTHKSVSTTYFLQSNDAVTGVKILEQELKDHSNIKEFPIETMGAANQLIWLFAGELMAFDPFSLEKKADIEILETKNPALKTRFPKERQYYQFNRYDSSISITATDGTKWQLNTQSMLVSSLENETDTDPFSAKIKEMNEQAEQVKQAADSLMRNVNSQKNMAGNNQQYFKKRELLYKKRDSINRIKFDTEKLQRNAKDRQRIIEDLQETGRSHSYPQMKVNSDTLNGKLYGLYTNEEFEKAYDRFEYRTEYDETSSRKLLTTIITAKDDNLYFEKKNSVLLNPSQGFLHGGFLLDKNTGMPIRLGNSWLVLHKTQIGKDGTNLVSKVNIAGNISWTSNTKLPEWMDWFVTADHLYIFGVNNKTLSSSECNVLLIINLATGQTNGFDYFTDKSIINP